MLLLGRQVGLDQPLFLIAGPCVIESEQLQLGTAVMQYLHAGVGDVGASHVADGAARYGSVPRHVGDAQSSRGSDGCQWTRVVDLVG